ncbi:P-loop containing nucleoside triphosphate hydrolase protein [Phellopilus nigrolimitatus]|nr:P-loop containing nucleoside triphosphate hydrolase protein [Phellopilus nigrolimitatus]
MHDNTAAIASHAYAKKVQALIKLIIDLRALGAQSHFDLPRIAVIGNQSAGKSSLVEAISGITVPRASGTCTRCPMECRLEYSTSPFKCQVLLRIERDEFGNLVEEVKESKFGPLLHDKTELEDMLRRAQLAILNPSVAADRFVNLDLQTLEPDEPPLGSRRQLQFSANVVCVQLSSPDSADLSFIDLPGIISNVTDGEDPGNIDLIKNLVQEHISGNSLILLTITMRDDIQNQSAALLAKAADPQGSRTIGVLTKPDTLQEGEHSAWIDILAGKINPLTHGYYVTKQPAVIELKEKLSYEEGRARERAFFEKETPWREQPSKVQSRMGVPNLTKQLSKLLSQLIEKTLPKLRQDSRASLMSTSSELSTLPPPPPENPTSELLKLVTNFTSELNSHVQGLPNYEGLIQRCRPAYNSFGNDILTTRPMFIPFEKDAFEEFDDIPDEPEIVKEDIQQESRLTSTQSPKYIDDVRELIKLSLTRELPYNVPFSAKVRLIEECFETWPSHFRACFDEVHDAYQSCLDNLLARHFQKFTNGGLFDQVRNIVDSELALAKESALDRIDWLLKLENPPFTLNDFYFSDYRERYLTSYRKQRQTDMCPNPESIRSALKYLSEIRFKKIREEDLSKLDGPDPFEQELMLMAEVSAYFRVAYKRVIDNLPRSIDHDFLRSLKDRMQDALITGLGLDGTDNKEIAGRYLSEDPDITARRTGLEITKKSLEGINRKLNTFATLAK